MIKPKVNYIDVKIMREMCHPIAVAVFDKEDDPISAFDEHELSLLESALANASRSFGGQELYPTIEEKAAILYYSLIKNHPFRNGNKRLATASLLVFLFINDLWVAGLRKESEDYLVNLAINVAESRGSEHREQILTELVAWLNKNAK